MLYIYRESSHFLHSQIQYKLDSILLVDKMKLKQKQSNCNNKCQAEILKTYKNNRNEIIEGTKSRM